MLKYKDFTGIPPLEFFAFRFGSFFNNGIVLTIFNTTPHHNQQAHTVFKSPTSIKQ